MPLESDMTHLAEQADNLFIYAATVLRFIGNDAISDPRGQLALILGGGRAPNDNPYIAIDRLYLQVLQTAVLQTAVSQSSESTKRVEGWVCRIIRTIMSIREPLPVTALGIIAGIPLQRTQRVLKLLHSVIRESVSPNNTLRICHPSFIDFITNKKRCADSRFLIDVPSREISLAQWCLELMVGYLGRNMAGMEDEAMRNIDVVNLEGRVKEALHNELRYACLHWASHMMATEHADEACLSMLNRFTCGSLLNWMEAMSLLEEVPRAILMMRNIHAWAVSGHWLDYAVTDDQLI